MDRFNNITKKYEPQVLPKVGVKGLYDTFVLNRTLVFQINNSAKTPRLRQYPNSCMSA